MPTATTATAHSKSKDLPRRKKLPRQKQPSYWMLAGILQSLTWLFVIPFVCRRYIWDQLFGVLIEAYPSHGFNLSQLLMTVSLPPLVLVCYTLPMATIYAGQYPFFEKYKIHQSNMYHDYWPWFHADPNIRKEFWKLSQRSVRLCIFNMAVIVPLLTVLKLWFIDPYVLDAFYSERQKLYHNHMFSTSDEHWPSNSENLRGILALTLIHEFGFYATHRLMHAIPFLHRYHKVHHEYKTNTVLAAQHNHPVDYVLSIAGPALLSLTLVPASHSVTQFQWILWALCANMDDHLGYAFPWSPVRWFPFASATEEHEFHHSHNKGCYSSKLSVYGSLLGDYGAYHRFYYSYDNKPSRASNTINKNQ
ncbi:unnamed protein product [Pseudo-nitzschia multistriata]|uniref:Fatty acid hydroxylase domain-containing protein n=1 Tax=Pseudo-nitzschia multistriata TaxID=183589 RepID=A0A448ZQ12_9STRA|nr:unnamed protein product [Pseudo-nitzschia multistriata]